MTFHHIAQVLERIQLNLTNPFACHANLLADLFESLAAMAVQTEAPLDNGTLFVAQLADPMIDDIVDIVFLRATRRLGISFGLQPIDRATAVFVRTVRAQCHPFVQCHEALDISHVAVQVRCDLGDSRVPILLLANRAGGTQAGVDVLDDVNRQPHRT